MESLQPNNNKPMLMDVVLMRLSLIFLLVICHAMCIYTGAFDKPFDSFPDIPLYDWIGMSIPLFQLQSMVFISGLLFGYTLSKHPERLCFRSCVALKAKRVLLPCYIFGVAYWMLFCYTPDADLNAIGGGIWMILNGIDHLWFLPMVFWCFVITYVLEKNGFCKPWLIWIFIVLATWNLLFRLFKLPLGLGRTPTYYLFFYVGYMLSRGRIKLPNIKLWIPVILFLVAFCASMFIKNEFVAETFVERVFLFGLSGFVNIIASVTGVYILYSVANIHSIQNKIDGNKLLIRLSGYCYGVYIFQQFILIILYYKTDMALCINPYILPWLATVVTIVLSLVFTDLALRTKVGRFLIG